jgi:hypothetical protein
MSGISMMCPFSCTYKETCVDLSTIYCLHVSLPLPFCSRKPSAQKQFTTALGTKGGACATRSSRYGSTAPVYWRSRAMEAGEAYQKATEVKAASAYVQRLSWLLPARRQRSAALLVA